MTTFTFFPNIPNSPDDPADDQPLMQTNAASTAGIIAVDHVGFNVPNGGIHNVINFSPQAGTPVNIGFGQLYAQDVSGQQSLFFQSNTGKITPLTNNAIATAPGLINFGSILIQWGFILPLVDNAPVVFPTPFTSAVFNIQMTPVAKVGGTTQEHVLSPRDGTIMLNGFNINWNGSVSYSFGYWMAIGL